MSVPADTVVTMSLFLITSEEVMEALEEGVEWTNRGIHVFVQPDLVPVDPTLTLYLMEFTGAFELRELTVKWTRNFSGKPVEDHAMCTFHIVNSTAGAPDASWTSTDYSDCEALFDTWWNAIKDKYSPVVILNEYTWRADGPAFKPFGSSLSPTLRIQARNVPGTDTSDDMLAPQLAVTVTEVIPATFVAHDVEGVGDQTRNRWGRFYLPAPTATAMFAGRIDAAFLTDFADATQVLYNALIAANFIPVVYSPTVGHAWSLDAIHVDDVWDVVRSRRYRNTLSRTARTITAV